MTSFEGVISSMERRYRETRSDSQKEYYESFMSNISCQECEGKRLRKESLAVTIGGKNIHEISSMSISDAVGFFKDLKLTDRELLIASQILKEINARFEFLMDGA